MDITTHADVDVVAVETDDEVSIMLELVAPAARPNGAEPRPSATVQVVLDRSGSMGGDRLDAAKDALGHLVDRLDPSDRFGLVTFDSEVEVVVASGLVSDKPAIKQRIDEVSARGMTNLAGGLVRGLQEARRTADKQRATVILLSDGHANHGEVRPDVLGGLAASARGKGVTTSTIGVGLGYDEDLLAAVASGGDGNHTFAETADGAAAVLAGEVDGLLSTTVQAASLIIRPEASVDSVTVWNDLPSAAIEGGVMCELGDLWAGETRKVLLTFAVPARATLGLAQVATLELRYVALPTMVEETVSIPVHVNVVPGDQAAGRVPDPQVVSELVFQKTQRAKREAADALRDGDIERAQTIFGEAEADIAAVAMSAPSVEWDEELDVLRTMRDLGVHGDVHVARKLAFAEEQRKRRKRGRRGLGD